MFTDKKNILQLAGLLIEHGVRHVVLCPGSRNVPIAHTLANHSAFACHAVSDERSAAYVALGLALHGGKPAAVCCTSGTALLNMHPAVAEAYYQHVPLIVISADRPGAWIGQMDGQTLPQPGVFGPLVKKAVNLPEIRTEEDEWYCNRLINEALLELNHHGKGPVHINVPISEPLFDFPTPSLAKPRVITRYQGLNLYDKDYNELITRLNRYNKRMVVVGQMSLIYLFEQKIRKQLYKHFAWLSEHTGNRTVPGLPIKNFDTALYALPKKTLKRMVPDLLITYGGHIVSKRLKEFLRSNPPKEHWHISADGEVADTFGSLTTVIEMDPFEFLDKVAFLMENKPTEFPRLWETSTKDLPEPAFGYSEMGVIGTFMKSIPVPAALHLANSSAIRYAQLFSLNEEVEVCCNRGTSGIEGSLSTAVGYSCASDKINFAITGDLSFFYDMNAIWNSCYGSNLRIMLLNNGGGEIFNALPGMPDDDATRRFTIAAHTTSASGWATERGFTYLPVHDGKELEAAMPVFVSPDPAPKPLLLEVFTNRENDVRLLKEYYHQLKEQLKNDDTKRMENN